MAESADINVDELRRRARRRLVGAIVLALGVAVVVPMLLETEQKPLGDDVSVKIPPIDDSKFVNRLSENRAKDGARSPSSTPAAPPGEPTKETPPAPVIATAPADAERPPKYDTRVPEAAGGGATPSAVPAPAQPGAATPVGDAAPGAVRPRGAGPAPAPPAAAKPDPNPPKGAAAPPQDGFAVQLAAFADDKGANALAGRLKKAGFAAYTEPLKTSKGTLWRVRVGPYSSREAAIAARDKLKSEGQSGIVAAVK